MWFQFSTIKSYPGGNIFAGGNQTVLLKPVNREYSGTVKKTHYYLNLLLNGCSEYLTVLFATNDAGVFSGNHKDALGIKPIMKVSFADAMQVRP